MLLTKSCAEMLKYCSRHRAPAQSVCVTDVT